MEMRMSCCANQLILSTLEHDEFAGQRCVVLPILVQNDKGLSHSLSGPAGLAVLL